ncbi:PspC family transcriptional regulator [Pedobacter petrophilus]|uniref:PspC family transcriptional regulator n=1 Tax=Pedobacter petrophilus TaxID=1908241 RepID=A0A7K0G2N8_9SPHI|nr:PspC family transcriptional regulator [Pedobacter petrophilus]MRX78087.1 PspC family transcriptional regulator [Pedobacter petrophilus]
MFQRIITYFEQRSFGVSTYLASKLNMSTAKVRLFFIYSSFLAVGFPILFYFLAAVVLDIRTYMKRMRLRIWE